MTSRRRNTSNRMQSTRLIMSIIIGVGLVIFAWSGAWASLGVESFDNTRDAGIKTVDENTNDAVVEIIPDGTIFDNSTNQDYVSITNRFDESATFTLTFADTTTESSLDFESSTDVSVSGNGDIATISLNSEEQETVSVTVAANASQDINTADFTLEGSTASNSVSVSYSEFIGPEVDT